jgi:hypothetical protein
VEQISILNRGTTVRIWVCGSFAYNLNVSDQVLSSRKSLFNAVTGYGLDDIQTGIVICSISYILNLGGSALPGMNYGSIKLTTHLHLFPGCRYLHSSTRLNGTGAFRLFTFSTKYCSWHLCSCLLLFCGCPNSTTASQHKEACTNLHPVICVISDALMTKQWMDSTCGQQLVDRVRWERGCK